MPIVPSSVSSTAATGVPPLYFIRPPTDPPTSRATLFLTLPSRLPELNPVENIWQFLRDNWLFNRVFSSHDDIVDHCCDAWNKLIAQPWKIMSIGHREWAHR